jgi:hypothetical protein
MVCSHEPLRRIRLPESGCGELARVTGKQRNRPLRLIDHHRLEDQALPRSACCPDEAPGRAHGASREAGETLLLDDRRIDLSYNRYTGVFHPQGHLHLKEFRQDQFVHDVDGLELEQLVFMVHGENTTVIQYEGHGGMPAGCTLEFVRSSPSGIITAPLTRTGLSMRRSESNTDGRKNRTARRVGGRNCRRNFARY